PATNPGRTTFRKWRSCPSLRAGAVLQGRRGCLGGGGRPRRRRRHRRRQSPDVVGGAREAEFFHPVAEGAGGKVQEPRRAAGAGDDPVGLVEAGEDVVAFHRFQAGLSVVGGWWRHRQKVVGRSSAIAKPAATRRWGRPPTPPSSGRCPPKRSPSCPWWPW